MCDFNLFPTVFHPIPEFFPAQKSLWFLLFLPVTLHEPGTISATWLMFLVPSKEFSFLPGPSPAKLCGRTSSLSFFSWCCLVSLSLDCEMDGFDKNLGKHCLQSVTSRVTPCLVSQTPCLALHVTSSKQPVAWSLPAERDKRGWRMM